MENKEKKNACCCGNDQNNGKVENKAEFCACGHDKDKAENKIEPCSCGHDKVESKAESCSCSHDKNNAEHKAESCCSHGKDKTEHKAESCCSHDKNNAEHKAESCCSHGKDKTEHKAESCCSHGKVENKSESCCSHGKVENKSESCCSHGKVENKSESCCAKSGKSKKNVEVGCGCGQVDGHEEEGGCCGTDAKNHEKRTLLFMAVSLVALIISFIDPFKLHGWYKLLDVAIIGIVLCGTPIFKSALKAAKNKKITSSMLISVAMIASMVMGIISCFTEAMGHESYFFVAGEIAFLMSIGSYIEDKTAGKSRSAIKKLIALKPSVVNLKTADGYKEINVQDIEIGDIVLVKPNEMIGIDGELVSNNGTVDQANITGESEPIELLKGNKVFAGTKNLNTVIEIKATVKSNETTVSKLIEYVKEAEKNKAPIARIADRFASYVVPGAIVISIVVYFIAQFIFKLDTLTAIQRGITILVVFCPCALALATPTAISAGIGNASKKGVLIKNGEALESMAHITSVAFDKTGTLTEGSIEVDKVAAIHMSAEELLQITASVENLSEHPIAQAIIKKNKLPLLTASQTESLVGIGIRAKVENKIVEVVKLQQVIDKISIIELEKLIGKNTPKTTVCVMVDGQIEGFITLSDVLRKEAKECISDLKNNGYKTVMLTGDNKNIAVAVTETLGLDSYKCELMPEEKVQEIEALRKAGESVLMVGDGVNDCPSLAVADCSLSMGAMGNSIAIDTAKVSLMKNDLSKIPFLLKLSKGVIKTIKFNIALSLTISFVAIICSTMGWLNAVSGALVHNASSILVCLNSALILGKTYSKKK